MLKKKIGILGLAGLMVLGVSSTSKAFQVKVDNDTFADIAFQIRVNYLNQDHDKDHDYRYQRFQVTKTRIAAQGQINKLVQFYSMFDSNYNETTGDSPTALWEGGVQFTFAPEFVLKAGKLRVPFSRNNMRARYVSPVMSSSGNIFLLSQFKDALKAINPYPGGYKSDDSFKRTDFGVVLDGFVKDGLFKYYIGVFNEDRSYVNKGWTLSGKWGNVTSAGEKDKKDLEYDVRIEFTPPIWGFKAERTPLRPDLRELETYLGKQDFMTIGFGYHREKHLGNANKAIYGSSDLTREGWAADLAFEKKLAKKYIVGGEVGYMSFDDTHFYQVANNRYKKGDAYTWYVSGHFTYGEKIGMGYPGVAFRYEYINIDGKYKDKNNNVHSDLAYDRWGFCLNYWFTLSTRVSAGVDFMNAKDAFEKYLKDKKYEDSPTQWYLGVYAQF